MAKSTYALASPVRTCGFSYSGNLIFYSTDKVIGKECILTVRDVRESDKSAPIREIDVTPSHSKITSALWGPLEEYIVTGHESGELISWDLQV